MAVQKTIKTFIVNFFVVAFLAASLLMFFRTYNEYRLAKSNNNKIQTHYSALLAKKAQLERINNYALLANKVNNAIVLLNYTPEKWTDYKVNLDKGLRFPELNYTLDQTQHGKDYFFIPEQLEITLPDKANLEQGQNIDAHLNLQGRYLVRK